MSFFKDFKADLSQAVSELIPSDEELLERFGGKRQEKATTDREEYAIPEEEFIIPKETGEESISESTDDLEFVIPEDVQKEKAKTFEIDLEAMVSALPDIEDEALKELRGTAGEPVETLTMPKEEESESKESVMMSDENAALKLSEGVSETLKEEVADNIPEASISKTKTDMIMDFPEDILTILTEEETEEFSLTEEPVEFESESLTEADMTMELPEDVPEALEEVKEANPEEAVTMELPEEILEALEEEEVTEDSEEEMSKSEAAVTMELPEDVLEALEEEMPEQESLEETMELPEDILGALEEEMMIEENLEEVMDLTEDILEEEKSEAEMTIDLPKDRQEILDEEVVEDAEGNLTGAEEEMTMELPKDVLEILEKAQLEEDAAGVLDDNAAESEQYMTMDTTTELIEENTEKVELEMKKKTEKYEGNQTEENLFDALHTEEIKLEEESDELLEIENQEEKEMKTMDKTEEVSIMDNGAPTSEDVAVITKGMRINGDVESDGSIEVVGDITGNVTCKGKLTISGKVNGNSKASEIFVNQARIEGEIISNETVKVGNGTVIVGNISATSAVIAGAVKGDIDVNGPVVVDASAVVVGNIKSRSVQINSGAVIEGTFSQCYNDEVDVKGIFDVK